MAPVRGSPTGSGSLAAVVTRVDVVVVAYNSGSTLRRCVESLAGADQLDVVVVDNASPEGGIETIDDLPVSIIRLDHNGGFAHGCNRGWRAGSAPYVLFINPDATLDRASLSLLVETLENDPRVGIGAPKILDQEGHLDFSMRRFPRLRSTYAQALFLHRLFPHAPWTDEVVRDADVYLQPASPEWVSGACFLIRRHLLELLGGFDEGFFMYSEDKDLCRRAVDAGWRISFVPEAVAVHVGGVSAPRTALLPVLVASRIRYSRKHSGWGPAVLHRAGIALGELSHMIVARGRESRAGHARALAAALVPSVRGSAMTPSH